MPVRGSRSNTPIGSVGDQRLDWEDKDVFTVPTWTFYEHVTNSGNRPAFLFRVVLLLDNPPSISAPADRCRALR